MFDLMFSNPRIENRFRALPTDKEIGGWFITAHDPGTWPGKYSRRAMQSALGSDVNPLFIDDVILVPNESDQPETQWKPWDFEKVKAIAQFNGKFWRGWPIHFHSHPSGNPNPSPADYAFAGAWLQEFTGYSIFCIITPSPLRLWLYHLDFGKMSTPKDGKLETGRFFSWRQAAVKGLVK